MNEGKETKKINMDEEVCGKEGKVFGSFAADVPPFVEGSLDRII